MLVESGKQEGWRDDGWCRRSEVALQMVTERSSQARECHERFSLTEVDAVMGRRDEAR
jgi:hypothetical protein